MCHGMLRGGPGQRVLALALLAGAVVCPATRVHGEPRFGDSTWVAPVGPEGEPWDPGPRVAEPDRERGWDKALRFPFRAAFFPLRMVARGLEATGGIVERFHPPGKRFTDTGPRRGLRVAPAFSYSGAAGPGIGASVTAPSFLGPESKINLSGTWSLRDNRRARVRAIVGDRVSPFGLGMEGIYDYRPNRRFYGIGNSSPRTRTIFLRRDEAASGYVLVGPDPMRRVRAKVGMSDISIGRGYNGTPRAADVFSPLDVPFLTRGSRVWLYGLGGDLAVLDDTLNPSRGLHVRPEANRVASTDGSDLRYDHWRVETRGYLPVFASRRVAALQLIVEGVDTREGSAPVPFYRLPESSGANRFAGYPSARFRDRRLALAHAEYRWIVVRPVWAVLFAEKGQVASTPGRLRLRDTRDSYGGGLRFHIGDVRTARLDMASGDEGFNIYVDLKGDF